MSTNTQKNAPVSAEPVAHAMEATMGYRLELKPGEYCYYTPEGYALEAYKGDAPAHALYANPQPGCPSEIEVYKGWCWVRPKYNYGNIVDETFRPLFLGPQLGAPVAAQPDVTQQTLDDVMAGIPARDAEIEALQKENLALLHRAAIDAEVASRLARRLFEISAVISPDTPIAQHDISDLLARVKRVVSTLAQQVYKSPETQEKTVDKSPDLQGHASVIFAKAVAWADARVDAALTQPEQEGYESACDDADQAHYELVQALRNLREAQQPVSGADGLPKLTDSMFDAAAGYVDAHGICIEPEQLEGILSAALAQQDATLHAEVLDMVRMLEANEWVDHCGKSELGQRLEWANTALQNRPQNIPEIIPESAKLDADKVQADLLSSLVEIVDAVIASDEEGLIEHSEAIIKARAAIDAARKEAAHG